MKIVFVNSLYAPTVIGGAERVLQSLAEKLLAAGHEPVVVCMAEEPGVRTDTVNGVRVHRIGLRNLYWPFPADDRPGALKPIWHAIDTYNYAMARAVGAIVRRERPDVVHTHTIFGLSVQVWRAVARAGIPLVHTLHDYYVLCPRASMFRDGRNCEAQHPDCRVLAASRIGLSKRLDAVVSVSRFVLDRHLALGAFASVPRQRVIHNMFRPPRPPGGHDRRAGGPLRVGFIGRLDPIKGVELLLDEVGRLPIGGWELRIAGRGTPSYEAQLRSRVARPDIQLLEWVDPHDFLDTIDVLVVPSVYHEPLGTVMIEALSHGVPVIGSRRGGTPELIEDGVTGLLFDPDTPGALRAVLERLVAEPSLLDAMHAACVARARDFGPSSIVAEHLALYAAVAARATGASVR